ncbi:chemotaxis protein [Parvibium lacunae]|uniref:Chemotaxis protein CheV n=1 Tax=Parvibium lacunae TaxID=1888893 RepID=A0A368L724_9BURK|nr:chemotaxis protein [Parvibium lacunae]RCS59362.1 chemotaxis protein CheV [Parvibium lacunae]
MAKQHEYQLIDMINDKARLAGSNKMELLLFSLGGHETFGINVFKVREVCETLPITKTPNMPGGVEGIISLRGSILPVLNLAACLNMENDKPKTKLIITEFSTHTQAFLVHDVDRIVRVDWDHVRAPQSMPAHVSGKITALTELPDGKLVSILDVEQILGDVIGDEPVPTFEPVTEEVGNATLFFADDSPLARKKIMEVLDKLKITYQFAHNGREAWEKLRAVAAKAEAENANLSKQIGMILVDAEMPEMDGYVLTRHIKEDARFKGIPVVMHSSLSSVANKKLGQQVGVDGYVAKFHPEELASMITNMMRNTKEAAL